MIGTQVRLWRTAKGLTLRELAAKTGLQTSYLSEVETGTRKSITSATLERIAGGLDLTLGVLLCQQPPTPTEAAPAA
jgi:transcriptional regulator with XRE-family HTH domain